MFMIFAAAFFPLWTAQGIKWVRLHGWKNMQSVAFVGSSRASCMTVHSLQTRNIFPLTMKMLCTRSNNSQIPFLDVHNSGREWLWEVTWERLWGVTWGVGGWVFGSLFNALCWSRTKNIRSQPYTTPAPTLPSSSFKESARSSFSLALPPRTHKFPLRHKQHFVNNIKHHERFFTGSEHARHLNKAVR